MKRVYIAHPFRDNPTDNLEKVKTYIKLAAEKGYLPLCALPVFGQFYGQVEEGYVMKACFEMIDIADEIWMCGDWLNSQGCAEEYKHAARHGKIIRIMKQGASDGEGKNQTA